MKKSIIIGDVHGCLEELDELLKLCDFRRGDDRLIFAGDLVDRGPDPVGVVRRARELRAEAVQGNHEEKHLRYRRHELKKRENPNYKNPMQPFREQRLLEHRSLNEDDWGYLENLPYYISVNPLWAVVHAGLEPGKQLEEQEKNALLRLRYVYRDKKTMASLSDIEKGPLSNFAYWTEVYDGTRSIFYGHHVSKSSPAIHITPAGFMTVGLDTGCCFGGTLTAAVMVEPSEFYLYQVKAKSEYATYKGWHE